MSLEAAILSHLAAERAHFSDIVVFLLLLEGAGLELLCEAGKEACSLPSLQALRFSPAALSTEDKSPNRSLLLCNRL